jgi:hypothetical protein
MDMKTKSTIVLACLCFLLASLGPAFASTTTVIALDSSSSIATDRAAICEPSVLKATSGLAPGDTVALVAIDEVPFGTKQAIAVLTFRVKSDSPLHVRLALKKFNAAILDALAEWRKSSARQTRVADAMLWASDFLLKDPAARKRLTVCSDGVEESPVANFVPKVPDNAFQRIKDGGFVPAEGLAGVEIRWIGLGGGKEASHVQAVTRFWTRYFNAARANVVVIQRNAL